MLGGMTGSGLTALLVQGVGTENLVLFSAAVLVVAFFIILQIQKRTHGAVGEGKFQVDEESLGGGEALSMLRGSRHLQLIALVIGFSALGATTLEQQLYMASEAEVAGQDAITAFLAQITFIISIVGFVIQIYFTARIYSLLGIGFALAVLPVSLGATAVIILLNKALWASSLARVSDSALRYSLDKTTRETLFLPLSAEVKLKAKGFVDVVADRFIGKGMGSVVLLVAIQWWKLAWWQLSILSLVYCGLWLVLTRVAKREYLSVFRRSIETKALEPERLTREAGQASTIETLVEELGSTDDERVLRSIEFLEQLSKRNLVTPLLLHHRSPRVRARAIAAVKGAPSSVLERWVPALEGSLRDEDADVRAAALSALSSVREGEVRDLVRPYLEDGDPRIAATAAIALAENGNESDRAEARRVLERLSGDGRDAMAPSRREAARAIARTTDPRFRQLLLPLMHDADAGVALEAIRSARLLGDADLLFVPALISLTRNRRLKNAAREALASYGEQAVPALTHFLRDAEEDPWVRRHIPGTLARIPSAASVQALAETLESEDGFLRYKAVVALEQIRRDHAELAIPFASVEKLLIQEATRYYRYLSASYNLFDQGGLPREGVLSQAIAEKLSREVDRLYRLLGLVYDWKDLRAARLAIERGDTRSRASAIEFLDNTLSGRLRKMILPLVDDAPLPEKVRKGNVFLKNRVRGAEETLGRLIYDEDPVIAAAAIDLVRERKLWSLADDLEQVLQFRDARDYVVFESASYALAAYRLKTDEPHLAHPL
jgi:AAA family ATP:ADP antiporter